MRSFLFHLKNNGRLHLYFVLAISVCTSLALEFVRISMTGHASFIFLVWNLFLACIPLWITMFMRWQERAFRPHFMFWIAAAAWLLFFPNSPYLITDFIHL